MKISTDSCYKWKKKIINWTVGKHFPVILEKDVHSYYKVNKCLTVIKYVNKNKLLIDISEKNRWTNSD